MNGRAVMCLLSLLTLAAAGCGGARTGGEAGGGKPAGGAAVDTANAPEAFAALLADVEARLGSMHEVRGVIPSGETSVQWVAYFDGPDLVHLKERMEVAEVGWGETGYWWRDGALRVYREAGVTSMLHGKPSARPDTLTRAALFAAGGEVMDAMQAVNGTPGPLPEERLDTIRRRAQDMAGVARRTRSGTPAP